jgi:hypothetical protein
LLGDWDLSDWIDRAREIAGSREALQILGLQLSVIAAMLGLA